LIDEKCHIALAQYVIHNVGNDAKSDKTNYRRAAAKICPAPRSSGSGSLKAVALSI